MGWEASALRVNRAQSQCPQSALWHHLQGVPVAGVECSLCCSLKLGIVLWSHRVDHETGWQIVALAQFCFTSTASLYLVEHIALHLRSTPGHELLTERAFVGQVLVRRVDDCVSVETGHVANP